MNKDEIEESLHNIKRKLYVNIDQALLIRQLSELSEEVFKLKKQKDYNETLLKLLSFLTSSFSDLLHSFIINVEIPKIRREIESSSRDLAKKILYKVDKIEELQILTDFLSYDSFQEVVDLRKKS